MPKGWILATNRRSNPGRFVPPKTITGCRIRYGVVVEVWIRRLTGEFGDERSQGHFDVEFHHVCNRVEFEEHEVVIDEHNADKYDLSRERVRKSLHCLSDDLPKQQVYHPDHERKEGGPPTSILTETTMRPELNRTSELYLVR